MSLFKNAAAHGSARIILKAYAYNHLGEIITQGERLQVALIDITPGGARLKMLGAGTPPPLVGETFACNIMLEDLDVESGEIPCRTIWREGQEFGVAFLQTLKTTITDLQQKLDAKAG